MKENKKDHKVTLKDYGFMEWFLYHYDNSIWFNILIILLQIIIGVAACYITITIIR